MSASLIARQLTVTRGPQLVLDSVDLTLSPGRRIGVVGPNGVGKSTLLRALSGEVAPDSGRVEATPPTANIGLLPQEPARSATESVLQFLERRTGVGAAQLELDATTDALATGDDGADDRYAVALDRWLALGAADFHARVGVVCADLGFASGASGRLLDQPTSTLSGGEAARMSLASLLLSRFDVVLLDEPTNDLDLDGLERLEKWVLGLSAPTMLISHDRRFLERTVTDVVEIDFHSHRATWFSGGWTAFLAERELARLHAQQRFDEFDSKRTNLLRRAQREREWASQGQARIRRTDEPDKSIRAFKINQTEQLAGKAARTERAIDRLDDVDEPRTPWELQLDIPMSQRSGDVVSEIRGARLDRGDFRLGPIDLHVAFGDRMAIVGANGAGKSTLIDMILGRVTPDEGTVHLGRGVKVGEIEQARTQLLSEDPLLAVFVIAADEAGRVMTDVEVRTLLAKFGLGAEHVHRPVSTLSPGERTRASLALLMAAGANLLVLDEPTNHLDMDAIEQLEQALDTYAGTVLLVSHDRALLERVALTRTIRLTDGRIEH